MNDELDLYLDVETDWSRQLTVVGFSSPKTGVVQMVGREITAARLRRELPKKARLFTYNGHCFDLPCIRKQLGVDLRMKFNSVDLRWVCQGHGLRGGQKMIEKRFGFRRRLSELDGLEAIRLWQAHQEGDRRALRTLLTYNSEDLGGLEHIRVTLARRGMLPVS